jgi:hypothetical protein
VQNVSMRLNHYQCFNKDNKEFHLVDGIILKILEEIGNHRNECKASKICEEPKQ